MRRFENMEQQDFEWLEPADVAKYLGISVNEVYRHLRRCPPPWPFYRVTATKRLTKRADLDAWLENVKVSAVTPNQSQS
jgi:hypothetical protein